MLKKSVTIVDSLPGSGKTEWSIAHMKENPDCTWMFISPYLDELKRVQRSAPELKFSSPDPEVHGTKLADLKAILVDGKNVCSTHALFRLFDQEVLDLIEAQGYSLIMDETFEVISPRDRSREEIAGLFTAGVLVAEGEGQIKQIRPGAEDRLSRYDEEYRFAKEGRLILVDGVCLVWAFPPDAFLAFREIFNLGYAYAGQQLSAFFQIHSDRFEVEKKSVIKNKTGAYELVPYYEGANIMGLAKLAPLIDVYEGYLNQVSLGPRGQGSGMYSHTWLSNQDNLKVAAGKLLSWLTMEKARPRDTIWTVYKYAKKESDPPTILRWSKNLKKNFKKSFLSITTRGTNRYQDRHVAAYLGNKHLQPFVKKYFLAMVSSLTKTSTACLNFSNGSSVQPFDRASGLECSCPLTGFGSCSLIGSGSRRLKL